MRIFLLKALAALSIVIAVSAFAEPQRESTLLIAKRQFLDPIYGASVVLATRLEDGRHIGFILNKPTRISLGNALPTEGRGGTIANNLYFGGPFESNSVFALINRDGNPSKESIEFAQGLYLATDLGTVADLIAAEPDHARVFVGAIVWRPGELDAELKRGLWHARKAEPDLVLRKDTTGLWEELVNRAEREDFFRSNGI
jgi:putative transcriptional regulator